MPSARSHENIDGHSNGPSTASERSPLLSNGNGAKSNGTLQKLPADPIEEDRPHAPGTGHVDCVGVRRTDEENGAVLSDEQRADGAIERSPEMAKRLNLLLPAVGIGIFLSAVDQTIIVSSYAKIGSELQALNSTSWIATAYFLTLTTFQPLYGKFSDIFGRKLALLVAYFIFGAGCIGCGLAQSMTALVAWRAFSGIGGGGMTTVVSILMSDIIPLRERGKWQGYVNIIYAAGAASGAPLGGLMADSIGWRWAFLLQGPLCFMAFIAVYFILKLPHQSRHHWRKRLRQIDFLGAILLILATSSLLVGLDRGSNVSWSSKITIGMISAAFPLYAIFMLVEHYATNPFAPSHIIFSRSLLPPFLCNFFAFAGYMAMLFYIPLYFQAVNGLSSAQAGVRLIPAIVGSVTGSVGGGLLMQKTGKYYWLTVCAYSMLFTSQIGVLLFSGIVAKSTVGIVLSLALGGLGGGIGVTTTLIALIACADPQDQAIVTACSYLFRSLGSAVGVSLAATIVQLRLRSQLADHLGDGSEAEKIVEGVRQSLEYLNKLPDGIRELVRLCYENSVRMAFVFSATVVVGAVVSSCFLREAQLSRR